MKKIYKCLACAVGIMVLDDLCYATQEPQTQNANNVNPADWALPEGISYEDILGLIPADNPERRNAFLAEVWDSNVLSNYPLPSLRGVVKDEVIERMREEFNTGSLTYIEMITEGMKEKPSEYSENVVAQVAKLTKDDWNKKRSQEVEDAKYAVQMYVQNQDAGFFLDGKGQCIGDDYKECINQEYYEKKGEYGNVIEKGLVKKALEKLSVDQSNNLYRLFTCLDKIGIGCPGCALTCDLIMDILRLTIGRLKDKPDDPNALNALSELLNVVELGT